MAEANTAAAIRRIFAACLANDRAFVENAFRFTGPCDGNIDKPACFESPQPPRVIAEVQASAGRAIGN